MRDGFGRDVTHWQLLGVASHHEFMAVLVEGSVWREFQETEPAVQVLEERLATAASCHVADECQSKGFGPVLVRHDVPVLGFDQKGLHMNENGSKDTRTLSLKGSPTVPLNK